MSTYIWAVYQEEPPWPPSAQAPNALRTTVQGYSTPPDLDGPIWIVDYEGDLPNADDVWHTMHMRSAG